MYVTIQCYTKCSFVILSKILGNLIWCFAILPIHVNKLIIFLFIIGTTYSRARIYLFYILTRTTQTYYSEAHLIMSTRFSVTDWTDAESALLNEVQRLELENSHLRAENMRQKLLISKMSGGVFSLRSPKPAVKKAPKKRKTTAAAPAPAPAPAKKRNTATTTTRTNKPAGESKRSRIARQKKIEEFKKFETEMKNAGISHNDIPDAPSNIEEATAMPLPKIKSCTTKTKKLIKALGLHEEVKTRVPGFDYNTSDVVKWMVENDFSLGRMKTFLKEKHLKTPKKKSANNVLPRNILSMLVTDDTEPIIFTHELFPGLQLYKDDDDMIYDANTNECVGLISHGEYTKIY